MTESEVYSIILNANYNETYIEKCLQKIKNSMFIECNKHVNLLCGIKRLNGKISDFAISREFNMDYNLQSGTYTAILDFDFINFFRKINVMFNYTNRKISISEINKSRNLFKYKALFFMDGYLMQELTFIPNNEITIIALEPKKGNKTVVTNQIMKELRENNSKWSLILEPHSSYINTYKEYSKLFSSSTIPISNIDITNIKLEKLSNWKIFSSCNHNSNFFLIGCNSEKDNDKFLLEEEYINHIISSNPIINVFGYNENNLYLRYKFSNIDNDSFYITVPDDNSNIDNIRIPIPIENIILWEEDVNKCIKLIHDFNIEQYYPNIYKITVNNINASNNIIVDFYYSSTNDINFNNLFYNYIRYKGLNGFRNEFINSSLPSILHNYTPEKFIYNYNDYLLTQNEDIYPTKIYKRDKLKEYSNENIKEFTNYCIDIENLNYSDVIKSWIINCNDSPHILKRSAYSNKNEISNPYKHIDFDKEYTFIVMSTSYPYSPQLCIWIDGLRIIDFKVYNDNYTNFIYIPKNLITSSSIIEIEMYINNIKDEQESIFINSLTTVSLNFNRKTIKPMDIMLIDNETNEYIPDSDFEIVISNNNINSLKHRFEELGELDYLLYPVNDTMEDALKYDEEGNLIIYLNTGSINIENDSIQKEKYYILNKKSPRSFDVDMIKIVVTNEKYLNKPLKILTTDKSIISSRIFNPKYPLTEIYLHSFEGDNSEDRFRIFSNGRLKKPIKKYFELNLAKKYKDDIKASIIVYPLNDKIELTLDYLPFNSNLIYSKKEISNDGVLKLKNCLSRPFDLSYYSIYLNGRKLNYTNIQIISETIVRLRNVYSTKNLYIFEKSFDEDIFKFKESDFQSLHEALLYSDKDYYDYIIDNSILESQDEGYIEDRGIIDNLEVDNEDYDSIESNIDGFIQKHIIQFIPILPDIDQLEGEEYSIAKLRFIEGTNRYRVNPDSPISDSDKERNAIHYNVDLRGEV